jgi:ribokinase
MAKACVTVFGSLNYDFVILGPRLPAPGETVKGSEFIMQTGGKGANQALQAARLGARTYMIGSIGRDFMGDAQLACLSADGIITDYITRHETKKTGVALIYVQQGGQNEIMIAANANEACTRELLDSAQSAFDDCGVFLTQLETNMDAVLYAMERARDAGSYIILDPAPMQPVSPEIWALADIVKPNETEAAYYTGLPVDETDIASWAKRAGDSLKAMGAPAVLITLGSKGCWYSGEEEFYLPSYKIKAVDATAAGDSFAGALATALGEGQPVRQAVAFASAAGAVAASRAGAQPSIGRRSEIEAFMREQPNQ